MKLPSAVEVSADNQPDMKCHTSHNNKAGHIVTTRVLYTAFCNNNWSMG